MAITTWLETRRVTLSGDIFDLYHEKVWSVTLDVLVDRSTKQVTGSGRAVLAFEGGRERPCTIVSGTVKSATDIELMVTHQGLESAEMVSLKANWDAGTAAGPSLYIDTLEEDTDFTEEGEPGSYELRVTFAE